MPVGTQRSSKTHSTQAETAVSSVTLHNSSPLPIFPLCLPPFSFFSFLHSSLLSSSISSSPYLLTVLSLFFHPPSPQDFSLAPLQVSVFTFAPPSLS